MKTLLTAALALVALTGCDEQSEPEPMAELEANGDTVERACWNIARDADTTSYSDASYEMAEQAVETCGPAPAGDVGSLAYYSCISEQCNCSGVNPSTGEWVCE